MVQCQGKLGFRERSSIQRDYRLNDRIRVREVRLIDETGAQLGIVPIERALELAQERSLDLVEVAPQAVPPVCRLLDYGKFKYEQAKKENEARKHQKNVVLREVRMKPKIGQHDIDFKTRTAEKLLKAGDKVKVTVMFRGREITHPEIGRSLLDRVYEQLKDFSTIENPPRLEGRFLSMILAPGQPKGAARERATAQAAAGVGEQSAEA